MMYVFGRGIFPDVYRTVDHRYQLTLLILSQNTGPPSNRPSNNIRKQSRARMTSQTGSRSSFVEVILVTMNMSAGAFRAVKHVRRLVQGGQIDNYGITVLVFLLLMVSYPSLRHGCAVLCLVSLATLGYERHGTSLNTPSLLLL